MLRQQQLEAWARNRGGAVIGQEVADLYGLEVGDRLPILPTIWARGDGNSTWDFDIEGIVTTTDPGRSTLFMLFSYDYFDEARAYGQGSVGWYMRCQAKS